MKRDRHAYVTRDNTVTSHVRRHCDVTPMSRVSHATTTTPHHTMSVVTSVCGVSGYVPKPISSLLAPTAFGIGHQR